MTSKSFHQAIEVFAAERGFGVRRLDAALELRGRSRSPAGSRQQGGTTPGQRKAQSSLRTPKSSNRSLMLISRLSKEVGMLVRP